MRVGSLHRLFPAGHHDVEHAEYAGRYQDNRLEAPAENRVGGAVVVADSEEAQGEHHGDVPGAKSAVGGDAHAAGAEYEDDESRNQAEIISIAGDELTGEGEGEEADVGLEEIACPDTESEDYVEACAFHVEEHLETVPYTLAARVDSFDEGGVAEEIFDGDNHRGDDSEPYP